MMEDIEQNEHFSNKQKGFALVEVLGAVALSAILYAGYIKIEQNKIESVRSEVAGQQLNEIAKAANRYITDNYSTLMGVATSTQPALVRISDLQAANILDPSVSSTNAYGQSLCALVLQPTPGKLTGLVVTEGGEAVNDVDLSTMVGSVGAAGGGIYTDTPTALIGARGGWAVNTATYANPNQLGQNCSGAAGNVSLSAGHAGVALWFENNDLTSGFLYRESIPGRPELNRMTTSLDMNSNDITNAGAVGATSVDVSGDVTANRLVDKNNPGYYVDPASYSNTNHLSVNRIDAPIMYDKNNPGYYVDPASYSNTNHLSVNRIDAPIMYDKNNPGYYSDPDYISRTNINRPNYIEPQAVVTENTACSPNGRIAKSSTGKMLSCQNGVWKGGSTPPVFETFYAGWHGWCNGGRPQECYVTSPGCPAGSVEVGHRWWDGSYGNDAAISRICLRNN